MHKHRDNYKGYGRVKPINCDSLEKDIVHLRNIFNQISGVYATEKHARTHHVSSVRDSDVKYSYKAFS